MKICKNMTYYVRIIGKPYSFETRRKEAARLPEIAARH